MANEHGLDGLGARAWKPSFRVLSRALSPLAILIGMGLSAAIAAPAAAPVLPTGGAFVAGTGQIGAPNAGALTITQQSAKGVIDWNAFSIGAGGAVTINNGAGATLNRVTGGQISDIAGRLSATGSVYLVNPQGVVVSSTGQVLGGGSVVLSSRDIPTAGFMSGNTVTASGATLGDVTNAGSVVSRQGNVVLIGRSVTNTGDLSAANGSVSLNAANSVLLNDGASSIYVAPDASATGDVTQDGQIQAAAASLTAAGGNVYALAGNRGGLIQATGTTTVGGEVWLTAPNGGVSVAGKVVARNLDGTGGKIVAAGATSTTISGALDASGLAGGTILVGVTAPQVSLSGSTTLLDTAQLVATGGPTGLGGYIETSGHTVSLGNARIETGRTGTLLIDPSIVVITNSNTGPVQGTTYLDVASINTQLASNGAVNITADLDLTVSSAITCSPCATSSLQLNAGRSMFITAPISIGGSVKLVAATDLQQGNSQLYLGSDGSSNFNAPITARTIDINSQSNLIIKSNVTSTGTGASDTMKLYAASYLQLVNAVQVQSATGATVQAQYYQMELDPGSAIKAAGDINIQTDWFKNLADATVLQPGAGKHYYIYTTKPSQITVGGLAGTAADFIQYNASFDGTTPANTTAPLGTGNGVLYTLAPVLQYTVTGSVSKIYDGNTTATGLSLSNITNITGLQTNDTLTMTGTTGTYSQADVGQSIAVTLPTVTVSHTENNVTQSVFGYVVSATQNQGIIGTIKPAPLTVAFTTTPVTKVYDGGNDAPVSPSSLSVTGWKGTDGGTVSQIASATYANVNVGSPLVTVKLEASNFAVTGATKIQNYTLDPTSNTQVYNTPITTAGQITPATLSVVIKGNPSVTQSGGTNPNATLTAANYDVSGLRGSDAATINQTVGVWTSTTGVGAQQLTAALTGQFNFTSGLSSNYTLPTSAIGYGTVTASTPVGIGVTLTKTLTKTYNGSAAYTTTAPGVTFVAGDFTILGNPGDVTVDPTKVTSIVFATPNAGVQPFTVTVNTAQVSNTDFNFYKSTTTNLANAGPLQSQITGQGTINRISLNVSAPAITKVYDGTSRAVVDGSLLSFTGGTIVSGETITINSTVGTFQTAGGVTTANVSNAAQVFANLSFTPGGGALLSNYNIAPTITISGSTITKAQLTAQIINNPTKVYDTLTTAAGANSNTGLLSNNYQLRGFIGSESITVSQAAGTYGNKNAGVQSISATLNPATDFTAGSGTLLTNYNLPATAAGSGTITPIALTVTGATATDKTYDKSTYVAVTGGTISSGVLTGDTVNLVTGHADAATADVGTTKPVTATGFNITGTDGANYKIVQPTGLTATITRAPINLTVLKTYDGTTDASSTVPNIQYNFTGVYNGDTIGIAPQGNYSQADVGTGLTVTLTGNALTGASAGNYNVATTSGTITKANLTATLADQTKTYDGTTADTLAPGAITLTGVHGETATATNLPTAATYNTPDAGAGNKTVTADLTGATVNATGNGGFKSSNYNAAPTTVTNTTSTITPAALTITLDNQTKQYDGTTAVTPALTSSEFHVTGLVHGETLTITQTVGTYTDPNAGAGNKTVNATIRSGNTTFFTGGGATTQFNAANYTFNNVVTNTTSTITPGNLTLNLTKVLKVYDGTTALPAVSVSGAYTLTGVQVGDTVTLASITGNYADPNVSNAIKITMTGYTLGGAQGGNYTINALASNNTIGQITQAPLGITVTGSKIYDGATTFSGLVPASYTITNLQNGETVQINQTAGTFSDKNVATPNKTITATLGAGNFVNGSAAFNINNYSFSTSVSGAGTITLRPLTVTGLSAQNKVYDNAFGATLTGAGVLQAQGANVGLITGDAVTLGGSGAGTFASKNVGTGIGVTVAGFSISGNDAPNYSFSQPTGLAANITLRPVTLTGLTAQDKVFDNTFGATVTGTAALETQNGARGIVTGDTNVTLTSTSPAYTFAQKNVGTAIGVTATGYGLTGTSASNYSFSAPGNLAANITVRPVTLTGLTAIDKIYDANTTATVTGTAALETQNANRGIVTGDTNVTLVSTAPTYAFANKNVGTAIGVTATGYSLTGTSASNYSLSSPASLAANITVRPLTFALNAQTKIYDGTTTAALTPASFTITGLQGGETLAINRTSGVYNSKNVIGATSVTVSSLVSGDFTTGAGFLAGNYSALPTTLTAAGTITPRTLTASLSAQTKVYDATTAVVPAVTSGQYTVSGLQNGETLAINQTVATYDNANVGSGNKTVTASLTSGNFTGGNGFLNTNYVLPTQARNLVSSITSATLNLTIDLTHVIKVYDGTTALPTLSSAYTLTGVASGDTVTVASATGNYLSPNVGTNIAMNISSVTLGGAQSGNYVVNPVPAGALIGEITPLTLTASIINNPTKVYDGTTTALLGPTNFSLTGFIGGQGAAVTQTAGLYASPNAGSPIGVTATLASGDFTANSGTLLSNYVLPVQAQGPGVISPRPITATIVGTPTKDFDGTTTATLTPVNYALTGLLGGQTLTVTQTTGAFDDPNPGNRSVSAVLNPSFFTPGTGTLLGNYSLPASATGPGLINTRNVIVETGEPSVFSSYTALLASQGVTLADTAPAQRAVRSLILTMATPRIYIPFPAEGALSTWKGNGFSSLPIVVDQTTNAAVVVSDDGNVATQSGPPMINNTEQVLLTGVRNKQYRIIITSQAANGPTLASQ